MAVINAVVTDHAREVWVKMVGGLTAWSIASFFRIGEGGWQNPGTGRERRTPDKTFTDLDIILDGARPAGPTKRYDVALESFGYFQKSFVSGDLTFESPTTLACRCLLDFGEYNTKAAGTLIYNHGNTGLNPEIWELGVYDLAGNLLAYGTVEKETKDGTKQIENTVRIVF